MKMKKARVLFTGPRAPVTLELARAFHREGHEVFVADSLGLHLLRGSRSVRRSYRVPAPRADREARAFAEAIADIARRESIDLLVPTCEEIFHVARRLDVIAGATRVFAMPIERLAPLHSKWDFIQKTLAAGVRAPETELVTSREEAERIVRSRGPEIVMKPVYSRFATRVLVGPRDVRELNSVGEVSTRQPWVAQRLLRGNAFCTFSIAQKGRLTLHSAYGMRVQAGKGAAILFRPLDAPHARRWVEEFARREELTGQVAFDFIDVPGDALYAIECNPRATSGAHLFRDDPRLARAYLDENAELALPEASRSAMLSLPLLVYGWRQLALREFAKTWLTSRDVAFDVNDPMPAITQAGTALELVRRAVRSGISPLAASTIDIEWNGPEDRGGMP
jgi:hypothetical protein